MADLLDIAPSTAVEVVRVDGGQRIKVYRLHADAVASLAARFPRVVALIGLAGGDFGPPAIAQLGEAIGPIIAAGCGHLGDERYEHRAGQLLVEDQFNLVMAIWRLTFPNGLAPFTAAMANIADGAREKPVRMRLRKSPSPSPTSSDAVSRPNMQ